MMENVTKNKCIYCQKPLKGWGATHFFCGLKHPRLAIKGTISHGLHCFCCGLGLWELGDWFKEARDNAEDKMKKLGDQKRAEQKI
jgi:hypothetical protein